MQIAQMPVSADIIVIFADSYIQTNRNFLRQRRLRPANCEKNRQNPPKDFHKQNCSRQFDKLNGILYTYARFGGEK